MDQLSLQALVPILTQGACSSYNFQSHLTTLLFFPSSHSGNVTVVSGHLARLNCRVRNLGNRTVSWIRLQDLSLLTVGRYTYTSDLRFDLLFSLFPTLNRFEGIHAKHSPDWQLALKNTRLTDSGALSENSQFVTESAGPYECQVSTSPHMAHVVHLRVRGDLTQPRNTLRSCDASGGRA